MLQYNLRSQLGEQEAVRKSKISEIPQCQHSRVDGRVPAADRADVAFELADVRGVKTYLFKLR